MQRDGSCLPGLEALLRKEGILLDAPAASRMLTFEIGFAASRGAPISARANFQGHLRGPNAPILARKA